MKRELMDVLRGHFRPEFLNRIDEIIVFHALGKEEIRAIVSLQLERLKRTAHAQGLELEFDDTLMDHLSTEGFRPEFGARELRRLIRSEIETKLASAMLADQVKDGDRVRVRWDPAAQEVKLEPEGAPAKGEARARAPRERASFAREDGEAPAEAAPEAARGQRPSEEGRPPPQ